MSIRKCIHSLDSPSSFSPRLPLKSPRSSGFHPLCRHHLPASSPSSRQVPKVIPPVQPTIPESPTWPRSHPALTYSDDLTREDSSRLPLSPPQATSVRARSRLHQPAPPRAHKDHPPHSRSTQTALEPFSRRLLHVPAHVRGRLSSRKNRSTSQRTFPHCKKPIRMGESHISCRRGVHAGTFCRYFS